MAHIQLDGLCLTFTVRQYARTTLKEFVVRSLLRRRQQNAYVTVEALKGVSFQVREGERVGVIGGNGAGKSTLLRVLAGIYPPTGGRLRVQGKISSLFDIGLGFEPEASGWENIAYRGYLQGETPASIKAKMKAI